MELGKFGEDDKQCSWELNGDVKQNDLMNLLNHLLAKLEVKTIINSPKLIILDYWRYIGLNEKIQE